jgi:hypothetical protein
MSRRHAPVIQDFLLIYDIYIHRDISYAAPEVLLRKGHGKPVDMWSIGYVHSRKLHVEILQSTDRGKRQRQQTNDSTSFM